MSESTPKTYDVRQRTGGFATAWPYKAQHMERMDESDDGEFYSSPRFVTHIDDRCIHHLAEYYGSVLPPPVEGDSSAKPRVLDVASSWISHLPEHWAPSNSHVVGVGMNKAELSKNRALARYLVLDLNRDPAAMSRALLEGAAAKSAGSAAESAAAHAADADAQKYDAAICSVSIDYLAQPRELLADVYKLLKSGGGVHLAFSNRMFPTKVVKAWLHASEAERCDQVADYLHFAGTQPGAGGGAKPGELYRDVEIVTVLPKSRQGDPLWVVRARKR